MKKNLKKLSMVLLATILVTGFVFISCEDILVDDLIDGVGLNGARATTITSNQTGTHDGYNYELWKDSGNVSMTLENGGNFSCSWSNIGNVLCRKGKKFDSTKTHNQIGQITIKYDAQFTPGGNSYLCVYGWSKNPLVEYYIIESYGTYKPGGSSKGTVTMDGGTYELSETTRTNQPSIEGTKTFKQYWAIRTSKRTSGTIDVTKIFNAWYDKGMSLGNLYEVALTAEGYQSSGSAKITSHTLTIGGSSSSSSGSTNTNTGSTNTGSTNTGSTTTSSGATKIEAENMTKGGKYTGNTSSPFNGVILYANDDNVSFSQNFTNNSHTFKVRGASSNDKEAQVQLKIGGTSYGTFKFKGTSATEQSITATHNKGGNSATVELVCVNDNDTWDVKIDWVEISAASGSTNTGTSAGNTNTGTSTGNTNTGSTPATSGVTKIEAENMTKGGKYTGNCSSPFNGVTLYANDDKVSFSQNFANSKHTFKLRGASTNDKKATVQLKIGGTSYGTFEFSGTSAVEKTITATHNQNGKTATVELICVNDNDTWDVKLDWLEIAQ
jgi:hypothetical protein